MRIQTERGGKVSDVKFVEILLGDKSIRISLRHNDTEILVHETFAEGMSIKPVCGNEFAIILDNGVNEK